MSLSPVLPDRGPYTFAGISWFIWPYLQD